MFDRMGRVVCHFCKSNMRLVTILPVTDKTDRATFHCDGCDHQRELIVTRYDEKKVA